MNTKAASERYQRQVGEVAKQAGNDTCADCHGRMPRWSSWNLGIFLCVNCAAVHRKMGTHVSKVKSLTLDIWTKEQVERMREIGNVKSNLKYNPDERRHRPPANVDEGERNSELERYIFDKYRGRFAADARPQAAMHSYGHLPPPLPAKGPREAASLARGQATNGRRSDEKDGRMRSLSSSVGNGSVSRGASGALPASWATAKGAASASVSSPVAQPALPARNPNNPSVSATANGNTSALFSTAGPSRSLAPPAANVPPRASSASFATSPSGTGITSSSTTAPSATATSTVFDDLLSLSTPTSQSPFGMHMQMPVQNPAQQMNPWAHLAMQQQAVVSPMVMSHATSAASPYSQQAPVSMPMQSQQQLSLQPMGTGWAGVGPQMHFGGAEGGGQGSQQYSASLGNMAFTSMPMSASPASPYAASGGGGPPASYFGNSNGGASPMMMGQSAFQQPQQQHQQQQQQQVQHSGGVAGAGSSPSNPFGAFANSMMPGTSPSTHQQAQTYARGWPGTKQNNPWA